MQHSNLLNLPKKGQLRSYGSFSKVYRNGSYNYRKDKDCNGVRQESETFINQRAIFGP